MLADPPPPKKKENHLGITARPSWQGLAQHSSYPTAEERPPAFAWARLAQAGADLNSVSSPFPSHLLMVKTSSNGHQAEPKKEDAGEAGEGWGEMAQRDE